MSLTEPGPELVHGTSSAYCRAGCHCDECRRWNAQKGRRSRLGLPEHDSSRRVTLSDVPMPGPWYVEAACRASSLALFFPPKGGTGTEAKAVCGTCLVIDDCRSYSLAYPGLYGVWGGMTEIDRRRTRKKAG